MYDVYYVMVIFNKPVSQTETCGTENFLVFLSPSMRILKNALQKTTTLTHYIQPN